MSLLRSRNRCLTLAYKFSRDWIADLERGNFDTLEAHFSKRDGMIRALRLFDDKIVRESEGGIPSQAGELLEHSKSLVEDIFELDQHLSGLLERESDRMSAEVALLRRSRAVVSKFKMGSDGMSGTEVDGRA